MIGMNQRHGLKRKEEFIMDRYTVVMRHKTLEFLQLGLEELSFALPCPDKTHEKDLKHRMQ